jgi:hypothetical protein
MQDGINTEAGAVVELVEAMRPLLAGKSASVQGAALADLLAMWLAGHISRGDPEGAETKRIREEMLELHLAAVRALIPVNYKMVIEPQLKRRRSR